MRERQNRGIRLFASSFVGVMLIELMIGLVISLFIVGVLVEMYIQQQRSEQLQMALVDIQYRANRVIHFLKPAIQSTHSRIEGRETHLIIRNTESRVIEKEYFIYHTKQGVPALFMRDSHGQLVSLVSHINNLSFHFTVDREGEWVDLAGDEIGDWSQVAGVAIEFDVEVSHIKKHWYSYVALQ